MECLWDVRREFVEFDAGPLVITATWLDGQAGLVGCGASQAGQVNLVTFALVEEPMDAVGMQFEGGCLVKQGRSWPFRSQPMDAVGIWGGAGAGKEDLGGATGSSLRCTSGQCRPIAEMATWVGPRERITDLGGCCLVKS